VSASTNSWWWGEGGPRNFWGPVGVATKGEAITASLAQHKRFKRFAENEITVSFNKHTVIKKMTSLEIKKSINFLSYNENQIWISIFF